jgi:hypothetical protein
MNHRAVQFLNQRGPEGEQIIDLIVKHGNLAQAIHFTDTMGDRILLPTFSVALNICRKGAPLKSKLITGWVNDAPSQIHAWMEMEINDKTCVIDVTHIPRAPIQIVSPKTFREHWLPKKRIQEMSLRQLGIKVDNIGKKEFGSELRVDALAHVVWAKTIAELGNRVESP